MFSLTFRFKSSLSNGFLSLVVGLFLFIPVQNAFAIDDEFNIKVLVGEDLVPPTTPVLLSVDPVAPTQIDITWSVSTDNVSLAGYVLLRDSVAIATTTLNTFIDTGLLPETLYSYEVYAFDTSFNISTTSNALATTTPAVPIIPVVEDNGSTESTLVFRLLDLEIKPESNKVFFDWRTSQPSRFLLRWGKSDSYDAGYISGNTYRSIHKTVIDNLEPGSVYVYELIGYNAQGLSVVLKKGQFKTLGFQSASPTNVKNLAARVEGDNVFLSWILPENIGNGKVRILRSHLGYPNDIYAGAVVYEGKASNFLDREAFSTGVRQFYTVFVVAEDGSVSSGAVAQALQTNILGEDPEEPFNEPEVELANYDFKRENIQIFQGSNSFDFTSDEINLNATESFLLSIPADSIPNNLKSIVVTIIDPTNPKQSYSFLLRINKERTAYEASIAALNLTGSSRLQIEIFDFEQNIAARYRKPVNFTWSGNNPNVIFPDKIVSSVLPLIVPALFAFALLLLVTFLFLLYRRRSRAEDNI